MAEAVLCPLRNHFEACQDKNVYFCNFLTLSTEQTMDMLVFTCLCEHVYVCTCVCVIRIYYGKVVTTLRIVFVYIFEHLLHKLAWIRSLLLFCEFEH